MKRVSWVVEDKMVNVICISRSPGNPEGLELILCEKGGNTFHAARSYVPNEEIRGGAEAVGGWTL